MSFVVVVVFVYLRSAFVPPSNPKSCSTRSIGKTYAEKVGSSTLHAHRNIKTISSTWRPRRERRGTSLACLAVDTRQGLWECKDLPPVQKGQVEEDKMSDSESEGEEPDIFIPSIEGSKTFFSKKVEGEAEEETKGSEGGGEAGGQQVMRDRKMLDLARKQRERYCRLASRLPDRMKAINDKLENVKHLFFLQTPFHRLDVQYPAEGDTGKGTGPEAEEADPT